MTAADWGFDLSSTKWWGSVFVAGIVVSMIANALFLVLRSAAARLFRRFRLFLLTASETANQFDARFAQWLGETRDLSAALLICWAHRYNAYWCAGVGFFFGTLGLAIRAYEEIAHHPEIGLLPTALCFAGMTWAFVQFAFSCWKEARFARIIYKSGLLPVDSEGR